MPPKVRDAKGQSPPSRETRFAVLALSPDVLLAVVVLVDGIAARCCGRSGWRAVGEEPRMPKPCGMREL
jgi:hypothetical protein